MSIIPHQNQPPKSYGKQTRNLALRSFFVLSKRDKRTEVRRTYQLPDENGNVRFCEFLIMSGVGIPTFAAFEVLMVIIEHAIETGARAGELSGYYILKRLDKPVGGSAYAVLGNHTDALAATVVKGTCGVKTKTEWIEIKKWRHLIEIDTTVVKDKKTGKVKHFGVKYKLGDFIWDDIQAWKTIAFDWGYYLSLGGGTIGKALFLYVTAMKHTEWEIDIFDLYYTHLGGMEKSHPSKIWEKLKPALEQAVKDGYLLDFKYPVKHGKYKRVWFRKPQKRPWEQKTNGVKQITNGHKTTTTDLPEPPPVILQTDHGMVIPNGEKILTNGEKKTDHETALADLWELVKDNLKGRMSAQQYTNFWQSALLSVETNDETTTVIIRLHNQILLKRVKNQLSRHVTEALQSALETNNVHITFTVPE